MIAVENIAVRFGEYTVFENVSFTVERGERLVILGGSGCGKSTLLKVMAGLLQPDEGRVLIEGEELTAASGARRLAILRKFGIMFQSGGLFGSMTLLENVALPLQAFTSLAPQEVYQLAMLKLAALGLGQFANYLPSEISGGMKKRAGLARAMALDPAILFFDEPSAGLDPVTSAGLDKLMININTSLGTTLVVVTHELDSIFSIATRVVMLDKEAKGVVAIDTPENLRHNPDNKVAYSFFNRIG